MRVLALAVLGFLLTACQALYPRDERSPAYVPPAETIVTLNRALTIPGDATSVYVQNGQVVSLRDVEKYHPHCKFEVWSRSDAARIVEPDSFRVKRSVQEMQMGSRTPDYQVAAIGIGVFIGANGDDGGAAFQLFATQLFLQSERQPDVYRLSCQQWGYLDTGEHVSISDMRRALGSVMTLRLPEAPTSS